MFRPFLFFDVILHSARAVVDVRHRVMNGPLHLCSSLPSLETEDCIAGGPERPSGGRPAIAPEASDAATASCELEDVSDEDRNEDAEEG